LRTALAIELFHNFTLLHDDVMDNAPMRRGRPTVHVRWDNNTAILSGDQMLIEAYKQLQYVEPSLLPKVLRLFSDMASGVCEGQQLDMDLEHEPLVNLADRAAIDRYIEMIRRKTAVLIASALQIGAVMAHADDADCRRLYNFGINLGLAFQLEDDLLDVYGNPQTFGKEIGGDIWEGKKTYLLLSAYHRADEKQRQQLLQALTNTELSRQSKYQAVRDIYDQLGVEPITLNQIHQYTRLALSELELVNVADEHKTTLRHLADRLAQRTY
jgi:geranylgeranyl diphosphate synthase type II